jgi:hypothetical protein
MNRQTRPSYYAFISCSSLKESSEPYGRNNDTLWSLQPIKIGILPVVPKWHFHLVEYQTICPSCSYIHSFPQNILLVLMYALIWSCSDGEYEDYNFYKGGHLTTFTTFPLHCPYWLEKDTNPTPRLFRNKYIYTLTDTHLPYTFQPWWWRQHIPPKRRKHCP